MSITFYDCKITKRPTDKNYILAYTENRTSPPVFLYYTSWEKRGEPFDPDDLFWFYVDELVEYKKQQDIRNEAQIRLAKFHPQITVEAKTGEQLVPSSSWTISGTPPAAVTRKEALIAAYSCLAKMRDSDNEFRLYNTGQLCDEIEEEIVEIIKKELGYDDQKTKTTQEEAKV